MGVVALILGIVALVFTFVPTVGWLGLIVGVVGIILGAIARKNSPDGVATAGLVCSIIGTAICAIGFIACTACVGSIASML